jgi:phage repressor protein C with HTH and peptisase S24 domain
MARSQLRDRLKEARIKAGFETATDAAEAFGWKPPTYMAHENGSRGVPRQKLETYARAFKVPLLWLLTGQGPQETPNYAGIIGKIGAGAEIIPVDGAMDLGRIELPGAFKTKNELVGFEVMGDSQYPVIRDGDVVFAGAATREPESLVGKECVVQIHDGPALVKTIEKGSEPGLFTLISANALPMRDVQLDWARKVEFIKRA